MRYVWSFLAALWVVGSPTAIFAQSTASAPVEHLLRRDADHDGSRAEQAGAADPAADARNLGDSTGSMRERELAKRATGLRLVVSLRDRILWLIDGVDTLHAAPVGVGKGGTLQHDARARRARPARGRRKVRTKEANPVWVPPLGHYVEVARERGFDLVELRPGREVALRDGDRLVVRGETMGRRHPNGEFEIFPPGEELVFGQTLYAPPFGTANRRILGELGRYKLDLGDGYLIHGTPDQASVGSATTHGCLRLREADLRFIFVHVPVGTPGYIY